MIEQRQFLSIVFLCSEFKLEYIYSNFFAESYFYGSVEKSQKLEPAKISCHTVSLVYLKHY